MNKSEDKTNCRQIRWYFDFISPFAYLQSFQLRELPNDIEIEYVPVLFAGLLKHWGQLGPAEIPAKRIFTFRHILWLANQHGIPFRLPPTHPFNPLNALRLCISAGNGTTVVQDIFHRIWVDGLLPDNEQDWWRAIELSGLSMDAENVRTQDVKDQLRKNTEDAIADGVFGVPTCMIDGELFWGFDGFNFLRDYLEDQNLLDKSDMHRVKNLPSSAQRLR